MICGQIDGAEAARRAKDVKMPFVPAKVLSEGDEAFAALTLRLRQADLKNPAKYNTGPTHKTEHNTERKLM